MQEFAGDPPPVCTRVLAVTGMPPESVTPPPAAVAVVLARSAA